MASFGLRVRVPFPKLDASNHRKTSPPSPSYNCFGWAIIGREVLMGPMPGYLWPKQAPADMKLSSFIAAIAEHGYTRCEAGNLEDGIEKIALYGLAEYVDHAARQLPNGRWTSKLGLEHDDIEHDTADCICGGVYGPILGFSLDHLLVQVCRQPHEMAASVQLASITICRPYRRNGIRGARRKGTKTEGDCRRTGVKGMCVRLCW